MLLIHLAPILQNQRHRSSQYQLHFRSNPQRLLLPQKEFHLLYKLLSSPGTVLTRLQLMDEIWGMDNDSDDHTVNVHINRLRNRFKDNNDFSLTTVRGLGYMAEKTI